MRKLLIERHMFIFGTNINDDGDPESLQTCVHKIFL